MKKLKTRLRHAWRRVPPATLKELAYFMPRRLKNVIKKQRSTWRPGQSVNIDSGAASRAKGPARAELHTYRNGIYIKPRD